MLIQFGHLKNYDYENELYAPLKADPFFREHQILLPYDGDAPIDSRETLKKTDIFFAEVSYPSTGLGIELGFANTFGTKIVCFYKKWAKIAGSLRYVCNDFFEYENAEEMLREIRKRVRL